MYLILRFALGYADDVSMEKFKASIYPMGAVLWDKKLVPYIRF